MHFFTLICAGPSQDGDKDLSALCQLWLESKDHVIVKVVNVFHAFPWWCKGTLSDSWFYVCFTAGGWGNCRTHSSNTQSVSLTVDYSVYLPQASCSNNSSFVFLVETDAHMLVILCVLFSLLGGLTMWWGLVQERKGMFFKSRLVPGSHLPWGGVLATHHFYIVALLMECSRLFFFLSLKYLCVLGAATLWSAT